MPVPAPPKIIQIIPLNSWTPGGEHYINGYTAMGLDSDGGLWGFTKTSGYWVWHYLPQPNFQK